MKTPGCCVNGCEPERRSGLCVSDSVHAALIVCTRSAIARTPRQRPAAALARRQPFESLGNGGDVLRRVAAAAAGDIDEPGLAQSRSASAPCLRARDRSRSPKADSASRHSGSRRWPRPLSPRARARNGYIRSGPSEQLSPTDSGFTCSHRIPEGLHGLRGDHVSRRRGRPQPRSSPAVPCRSPQPSSSKTSRMATSAALALSESKIVSTSSRSTPPAMSARACCA